MRGSRRKTSKSVLRLVEDRAAVPDNRGRPALLYTLLTPFLPIGVVAGPFIGALAGEMVSGKPFGLSLKGAFGALLGYVCGVVLKVACCGFIAYRFWTAVHGAWRNGHPCLRGRIPPRQAVK